MKLNDNVQLSKYVLYISIQMRKCYPIKIFFLVVLVILMPTSFSEQGRSAPF